MNEDRESKTYRYPPHFHDLIIGNWARVFSCKVTKLSHFLFSVSHRLRLSARAFCFCTELLRDVNSTHVAHVPPSAYLNLLAMF
ncbi:hypothetical protein RJT34_22435 [Clitoria ternatea]|uniref:Uncharacterized protein n=1 Tax=Clitoria ternatea TaxID=43366 RepID=A0AAN9IVS5_CLITE